MTANESHIVTTMTVTGLSVVLGQIAGGNRPSIRPMVGIAVTGFVLLAAANNPLATQFATLIATTAVLTSGYYTAAALARYFNTK